MAEFVIKATIGDGTTDTLAAVKVDAAALKLYVLTGVSTWTEVDTVGSGQFILQLFNQFYFTIDLEAGTYDKVYFNDESFDISAYSLPTQATVLDGKEIALDLQNNAVASVGGTMYVDNICASRNVP